ncbi:MAG: radical SAM protein [Zestosphaera sp.]
MYSYRDNEWLIGYAGGNPKELMVEITTACNYSCLHCFRNTMSNHDFNKEMDAEIFKTLLKQALEANVEKLSFSGWGEPLTHPLILDYVSEAKKRGLKVLLNTNGFFLADYIDDLYRAGVDEIHVSVDSVREEVYGLIRRGGVLSKVTEGLLKLKELKLRDNSFKPEVRLQFTLTKLNVEDLLELPEYVRKVAASQAVVSNVIPLSRDFERELSCYVNEECMKVITELKDKLAKRIFAAGGKISLPSFDNVSDRRCPFITRNACFVRFDGSVAPCIQYAHSWVSNFTSVTRTIKEVVFGNIMSKHLLEIWREPRYVGFRMNVNFFKMPSCFECGLKEYCKVTMSNEFDCWGNTPTCAFCPYSHDVVRCPL